MTVRIRSWGKWQQPLLYSIGKSRIANSVDPASPFNMASIVVASTFEDDFADFQNLLADKFADAYWDRLLRYVAINGCLTGCVSITRDRFHQALCTPWHTVRKSVGIKVYDAMIGARLIEELPPGERPVPTICAEHKRYLCTKTTHKRDQNIPNMFGTGSDLIGIGIGIGMEPPPPPSEGGEPAVAGEPEAPEPRQAPEPPDDEARALRPRDRQRTERLIAYVLRCGSMPERSEALQLRAEFRAGMSDDRCRELIDRFKWVTNERLARFESGVNS